MDRRTPFVCLVVGTHVLFTLADRLGPGWLAVRGVGLVCASIVIYFRLRQRRFGAQDVHHDPLNRAIVYNPVLGCWVSCWALLHMWVPFLGCLYCGAWFGLEAVRGQVVTTLCLGALWEAVEALMKWSSADRRSKRVRLATNRVLYSTGWESSWHDLAYNAFGLALGVVVLEAHQRGELWMYAAGL